MTVAVDVTVCHCVGTEPFETTLSRRDASKCRAYGAAGVGATLPSGESFLPFSVLGSLGHLSQGALSFLHLPMHDMTLKRVHNQVRTEVATSLSHVLARSETAILHGSTPLIGAADS
eukprot:1285856-Amphidinium_carterae.1